MKFGPTTIDPLEFIMPNCRSSSIRVASALMLALLLPTLPGCNATPTTGAVRGAGEVAPCPAAINHVVLFSLTDADEAEALIADCESLLAPMPEVISFFVGQHVDVGRDSPAIQRDYHVGLYVGFADTDAYARYVDHPDHLELVDRWGAKLESLRVYDIHDAR